MSLNKVLLYLQVLYRDEAKISRENHTCSGPLHHLVDRHLDRGHGLLLQQVDHLEEHAGLVERLQSGLLFSISFIFQILWSSNCRHLSSYLFFLNLFFLYVGDFSWFWMKYNFIEVAAKRRISKNAIWFNSNYVAYYILMWCIECCSFVLHFFNDVLAARSNTQNDVTFLISSQNWLGVANHLMDLPLFLGPLLSGCLRIWCTRAMFPLTHLCVRKIILGFHFEDKYSNLSL